MAHVHDVQRLGSVAETVGKVGYRTMKVAIIRTMHDGIALTKSELLAAPRHHGRLLLEDWSESYLFGRPVRRARLISNLQGIGDIDVVAPLFEPELVKVGDARLTFVGHEVPSIEGTVWHVMQVWLVKPYD